jgi:DNA-binding PadR family transcriptional regulator
MHFAHMGRHGRGFGHKGRMMKMMLAAGFGDDTSGFGGRGFGRGHGGPHGRRRGGRMFAGGELRLLLLSLVGEQPRHGYDLIRAIADLAGGAYAPSPGVVYPTLSLLVDEGMIAETSDGEGARKAFAATDAGRAEIAEKADDIATIIERLRGHAEQSRREDSPPVRRAVGNLMTVLRERAGSASFDAETAHAIAEILDEAARKVERL